MKPALLLDNYDSYTFNIFHLLAQEMSGVVPILVQNDDYQGDFGLLLKEMGLVFSCVVIGPGPGNPKQDSVGLSRSVFQHLPPSLPILGICLGMQIMALEFGGDVILAPKPMHGMLSSIVPANPDVLLFKNLTFPFRVVRYHSLCVSKLENTELVVSSTTEDDGVPMSLYHSSRPIFGFQFHPESICAGNEGRQLIANFVSLLDSHGESEKQLKNECLLSPSPSVKRHRRQCFNEDSEWKLMVQTVHASSKQPEDVFEHVFSGSQRKIWLDSSSILTGARFSIQCDEQGSFQEYLDFYIPQENKCMHLTDSHLELRQLEGCVLKINGVCETNPCLDPFAYLNQRVKDFALSSIELDGIQVNQLPFDFSCGYMGVLGYGLRKLCGVKSARLVPSPLPPECHNNNTSLPDCSFFFASRAIVFDHVEDKIYVLTLIPTREKNPTDMWFKTTLAFLQNSSAASPKEIKVQDVPPLVGKRHKKEYCQDVEKCLEFIRQGESYEVCLTTQLSTSCRNDLDSFALYQQLRRVNPAPLSAYMCCPDFAILSTSPERYLRVQSNGTVISRPIKGTTKRGITPEEDSIQVATLSASEKDRAESLMIVDLVRNDLGRVCQVGSVEVPDLMVVESFASVHQLVSTIQGTLKPEFSAIDATKACFPPGSMTGAPKLKTMQIIDSLEPEERNFYAGSLGYFSLTGEADFSVLIRTAVINRRSHLLSIGAGGAVVYLSNPLSEFEEMKLKLNTLGACFQYHI